MNKLILKKDVFKVDSDFSNGLICGLKKLSLFNFVFYPEAESDAELLRICKKEGIAFDSYSDFNRKRLFLLDVGRFTELDDNKNEIFTREIATAGEALTEISKLLRYARKERVTKETDIRLFLQIEGEGKSLINTGIGFFDHMLDQIARHSNMNLELHVKGDLHIDEHHTVEDVGITLGEAISEALGGKTGIQRYGFVVPMDESVAECAIDLSGRSRLNFNCEFKREKVGEFPTELVEEFFHGLSSGMKANIYIKSEGKNDHHKIESIFKCFAKALNEACRFDERNNGRVPSTKGVI